MAEEEVLKTFQCGFESHRGYKAKPSSGAARHDWGELITEPRQPMYIGRHQLGRRFEVPAGEKPHAVITPTKGA
jgi:hypothetical protein